MIITTARKPSSKIRIFCKHLDRFTGWEYVTRGKTSLSSLTDGAFLLVGEHKGNPGSFKFFSKGRCVLSIHANVSLDNDIEPGEAPVIEGESALALAFGKATGLRMDKSSKRVIHVNDRIEFIDNGIPYIILKVLSLRGEGIV
jgi:rRNA maturation protein Rpf1